MPQLVPTTGEIVVQRGVDTREIELLSPEGTFRRRLSTVGGYCTYPLVSPTGTFVAFARYEVPDAETISVEVVDLAGTLVYKSRSGSRWVNAAFRWDFSEDRLAIVVPRGLEERGLDVVDFSKP
jgi:hypothetical protein